MVTAFAALGACGGAGDVIDNAGGGGTLFCALTGCEIAKLSPTPVMPTGTASYIGRASVTATETSGTLRTTNADLALTANFGARTLTVGLTNFVTGSTTYSGSAAGAGSISGNSFSANYAGTIAPPSGGALAIGGAMAGTFRGDGAAALNGEISITGGAADGSDAFGQFFANRN
jgi:hypothetical protein